MPQITFPGLFPFCVTPTDDSSLVGPYTWYPLGLSLVDACAFFWKAKSFKYDLYNESYHFLDTLTYQSIDVGNVIGTSFVPQTETDFVCFKNKYIFWSSPNFNENNNIFFNFYGKFYNDPICYKLGDLYYFNLYITGTGFISIYKNTPKPVNGEEDGTFPFIINDTTYHFPIRYGAINGTSAPLAPTGSITIAEEWPYNP
jgi:hypothetical protein